MQEPPSQMPPTLTLYYREGCGYCHHVLAVARQLDLPLTLCSTSQPDHALALEAATGRQTVPVLRIASAQGDRWLPESRDIIRYIRAQRGVHDPLPRWVNQLVDQGPRLGLFVMLVGALIPGSDGRSAGMLGMTILVAAIIGRRFT